MSRIEPLLTPEGEPILGIDLGTTNSLAAVITAAGPVALSEAGEIGGEILVPSVVLFDPGEGGIVVGTGARHMAAANARRTIYSVKRLMGKGAVDIGGEAGRIAYELVADGGMVKVKVGDTLLTPQEISALILRRVKQRAESALGRTVDKAVVTVPAYFDDAQRQATKDAGRIAGLSVLRIVNEPTAAALAYGLGRRDRGVVAVYDLGGGTFDCSILEIRQGIFRVRATHGDTMLGGDDFDQVLMAQAIADLASTGVGPDPGLLQSLRDEAERVKIRLSDASEETFLLPGAGERPPYARRFGRRELEAAIEPLVERTLECCRKALADAGLDPEDVDEAILVGGSTRVPLVREKVAGLFGRTPLCELDPDHVVALGAAVQAGILTGEDRELLLLDVIPLSLGIETLGGASAKIITRNSPVPCRATERFSTSQDGQTAVKIHVVQGERELVKDCRSLARFTLKGIPPMVAGLPRIEVTFAVDADGILTVTAQELRSGVQASIEVVPSHGLTGEEVTGMVLSSIEHAMEDLEAVRLNEMTVESGIVLDALARQLPKARGELSAEDLAAIEACAAGLREVRSGGGWEAIKEALDRLNERSRPLAEVLMNRALREALEARTVDDALGDLARRM